MAWRKNKSFEKAILEEKGSLDSGLIEEEVLEVTQKMISENSGIGALLLECSDLPHTHKGYKPNSSCQCSTM